MKVLDLFCGCGGLSLGFEQAGYEILGGIDLNPHAVATFQHNFPESVAIQADLEVLSIEAIEERIPNLAEVEVLIGGPPCQGFSSANRWTHESEDVRNRLFFEFVELADHIQPKAILIENVRGIITRDNGYARDRIYQIFQERGYNVCHRVLNASHYGVPQNRPRVYIVGIRRDKLRGIFRFPPKTAPGMLNEYLDPPVGDIDYTTRPSTDTARKNYEHVMAHLTKLGRHPLTNTFCIDVDAGTSREKTWMYERSKCLLKCRTNGYWISSRARYMSAGEALRLQGVDI